MAQSVLATSDLSSMDWTPTPVYVQIGTSSPNDGSPVASGYPGGTFIVGLGPPALPMAGEHTLLVRGLKTDTPVSTIAFTLMQGASPVATRTVTLTGAFADYTIGLTEAEVDLITDYAALTLKVEAMVAPYIKVEEQDGTPSYPDINTLQLNQASGFVLTQPSAGVALVSWAFAGLTDADPALDDESAFADTSASGAIKKASINKALGLARMAPGGRLTVASGDPVGGNASGVTTLYYTPYLHDVITLWDGTRWVTAQFAEASLAIGTATNGICYDVFCYLSSGTATLEKLAWSSATARATAVTLQDGRYCKSGDKTRLYLGTFYTTSTTATADASQSRYVWNMYNRVQYSDLSIDDTDSWTNNGNGTWSAMDGGSSAWIHGHAVGLAEEPIEADLCCGGQGTGFFIATYDGSTTLDRAVTTIGFFNTFGVFGQPSPAFYRKVPGVGKHSVTGMNTSFSASNATFYGDNGGAVGGNAVGYNSGMRVRGCR